MTVIPSRRGWSCQAPRRRPSRQTLWLTWFFHRFWTARLSFWRQLRLRPMRGFRGKKSRSWPLSARCFD